MPAQTIANGQNLKTFEFFFSFYNHVYLLSGNKKDFLITVLISVNTVISSQIILFCLQPRASNS